MYSTILPSSYQFFLTISQMRMRKWTVFAAGKKVQAMELQEFTFNLQFLLCKNNNKP
jgi:hypothetical protein